MFDIAAKFGVDPLVILKQWPAWLFTRARYWLSANNQGEADREENAAALRDAMQR